MKFSVQKLELPSILLIRPESYADIRGSFSEVYRQNFFSDLGIGDLVQENYSCSVRNVVRGMHYQASPMHLGKLVSCPYGEIYDVVVDVLAGSPTFGKWTGVILEGNSMLWVPPGYAHGFCVLSDKANVLYRQTQYYSREHERSLRWNDPTVGIRWPISTPILSEKDAVAPLLCDAQPLVDIP